MEESQHQHINYSQLRMRPSHEKMKEFVSTARNMSSPDTEFLRNIFGGKYFVNDETTKNAERLMEPILMKVCDPGLLRTQSYNPAENVSVKADPVRMLTRQAGIYELMKRTNLRYDKERKEFVMDEGQSFTTLAFDLKGFREADEIGAGDYDLNIVAKALNQAESEIINQGIDQKDLIFFRYGGDEFFIFVIGDKNKEKINKIKQIIKEKVTSSYGYLRKGQGMEKFAIKNENIQTIEVPKNTEDRDIFLSFLTKGSIMNQDQLEKEKVYLIKNQNLKDTMHQRKNIYPPKIEKINVAKDKIKAKIEYLIINHPELKVPYWIAQIIDERNRLSGKKPEGKSAVEKVLDYYQSYLIDPLLNEIVLDRAEIQKHIARGDFSRIFVYEIKTKEINDNLSWTYADERVLKKIWEDKFASIENGLRKEINNGDVQIGRIGGSIIILLNKNRELSEETIEKLRKIDKIETDYGPPRGTIIHEIGYAEIEAEVDKNLTEEERTKKSKEIFNKIFSEPTKNWLKKTFMRILSGKFFKDEFDIFINLLTHPDIDDNNHTTTFLSAKYFTGNRWKNRIRIANDILEEILSENQQFKEKIQKIKESFNQIKTRYTRTDHKKQLTVDF